MIHKIIELKTHRYTLICTYKSGEIIEYDMSDIKHSQGIMAKPLKNPEYFAKVFLESGAPTWPNGYDVCPEAIYRTSRNINYKKAS